MKSKFSGIQGCINGRVVKLLNHPDKLAAYIKTLTETQTNAARSHIKTIKRIENHGKAKTT